MQKETNNIGIYELHRWGIGFYKCASKRPRSLESVVLDGDNKDLIIDDIKDFKNSIQWYLEKGIPYRRGYLLYGPPGSGKTSFVQAVAGALKLNICYLNIDGDHIDDDGLMRALNDAPQNSIILLEDVDGIFVGRDTVNIHQKKRVSFSGLLNAIDGIRSQEGRILFMTTNHKERLDPALIRPGRCDLQVELKEASSTQIETLFTRFFPSQESLAKAMAKKVPEYKVSMAKLQGHYLKYAADAELCVQRHDELLSQEESIKEMTVAEWLDRLNLQKYIPVFTRQTCFFVKELIFHVDDCQELKDTIKIKEDLDKARIRNMIKGSKSAEADFHYLNHHRAREILVQNMQSIDIVEEIMKVFPDQWDAETKTLTGFQLKDIMKESYGLDQLKESIQKRIKANNSDDLFMKDPRVVADEAEDTEEEETEEEKKRRWGTPKQDIIELIMEYEDDINKGAGIDLVFTSNVNGFIETMPVGILKSL